MSGRLEGKVAVITGSTSGIGRATAELFAREGACVVVNGRRRDLGEQVVAGIRADGGEATYFYADVGVSTELRALIDHAVATYGRLDVLMNNAYHATHGTAVEIEEHEWDADMAVLLKAAYLGCKYAIPEMIKGGGGSIINISSVHGVLAGRNYVTYETAKAGLINMTRQVAVDFGHQGIRVNAICPGWIIVNASREWVAEHPEAIRRAEVIYPVGRPGWPIDVARAALFLASDESSFITGHALMVDGGLTIQLQDSLSHVVERWAREANGDHRD
ncbi:MAG TPA: glucose 1-dehydrogenase [Chloroflexi bacterium]|nr:glucose 1-dehydrogenase [Chloroflexota bacterium]